MSQTRPQPSWPALFAYGFRPFFLFASLDALFNMVMWLLAFLRPESWPQGAMPALYWHAHEMLFGFVAAAIGGFLLTAVPGWTGRTSYSGASLMLLFALWLAGRVAMLPGVAPRLLATIVDLAFFPALALTIAPSLIRARKFRNLPFLSLLAALFLANLSFDLGADGTWAMGVPVGLGIGLDVVTFLIVIVGGRIVPAFTKSGLMRFGFRGTISSSRPVEFFAILSILLMFVTDMAVPNSEIAGAASLVAGTTQIVRLAQWRSHRTLSDPLIWVLHLGYAWLSLALLLKGISLITAAAFAQKWIHAFTIGAFTTMILGVMTRASLGHTGRALITPRPISLCYGLISVAAVIRVFVAPLLPSFYSELIAMAGIAWIVAFAIFIWVYTPMLVNPRVDGRPG